MAVNTSIDARGVYPVRADGETTTTLTINVDTSMTYTKNRVIATAKQI